MFLFQLLKYFPGRTEIIGAMVIPGVLTMLVFLMPYFGKWRLGHRFNLGLLWTSLLAVGLLTWRAFYVDRQNPGYVTALRQAERDAERAVELARSPSGIPSSGAVTLLRNDAYTQGPKLFARHCAGCHRYDGHDGLGGRVAVTSASATNDSRKGASDLEGFASRAWLAGLLDPARVSSSRYFGATKFADGKMAKFVKKDVAAFGPEQKQQLEKVLAAVSAEAQLRSQRAADSRDVALIEEGRKLFGTEAMRCSECHSFHKKDEDATGPELTGYGSREWLTGILTNPKHERYYGKRNDRMPAFGADGILDAQAVRLLVDWLRGEWYELVRQ